MGYAYIAFHPNQVQLLAHVQRSLESAGVSAWIKSNELNWEYPELASFLGSVRAASTVLIFLDGTGDLDPPEFLDDIIEANRQQKPIFVIKTQEEFDLLLPQIRSLLPRYNVASPLPILSPAAAASDLPPFRVRPGWLELGLLLLLGTVFLVIIIYLMR